MDREIFSALTAWASAYKLTSDNSTIILRDASDETMRLCAERIQDLQHCEQALLDMEGRKDLPRPLQTFLYAKNDIACVSCMYGGAGPIHHWCQTKINFMFRSTQVLFDYVNGLASYQITDHVSSSFEERNNHLDI